MHKTKRASGAQRRRWARAKRDRRNKLDRLAESNLRSITEAYNGVGEHMIFTVVDEIHDWRA